VLGSLVRSLEDEAERGAAARFLRRRARRAAAEADRLRGVLEALGGAAPPLRLRERRRPESPRRQRLSARIAAYTHGGGAAGAPAALQPLPAAPPAAEPAPPAATPRARVPVRGLAVLWAACAAALPATLAWRGVGSLESAAADVALLVATLALFAATTFGGAAPAAGTAAAPAVERRTGGERRRAAGSPPGGVERRSGRDRRAGPPRPAAPAASSR